ncbi:uncharacterized protein [Misgurnus anguillicaudatus]|uniref:uncharacterized protein n=1 Tax=Misgurnus anguillicaudatus TaxID=75329 RepID=UPI003CCF3CC5
MVLGTLAEHSLPFTMAPVIVELAQTLAKDKVALSGMKLSRTSAKYKMVHGLGKTFSDRILSNTGKLPFSLNLDEATSSSDKKVLSILVSYYNPERKAVDVEHLGSFEIVKVTAAILENVLDKFFTDNDIPWSNLVSIMMDSCAVMRGSKTGLETRVRHNHCPQLLDIDGDSCHHIHNASKRFYSPFNGHLEQLFSDLHVDHKWASDQRAYLQEICEYMSIPGSTPKRFIEHRWLSCYDVGLSTQTMLPAYKVLYFGFMDEEDKALYKEPLEQLYAAHHLNEKAKRRIQSFHKDLSGKGMTLQGRDRKQRVVKKLWHEDTKTELHLSVYTGVLAILKEYVMVFQSRDTLVHKLHDKQLQVFTNFLACFVKPEHLPPIPRTLAGLKLKGDKLLPARDMYVGRVADRFRREHPQHHLLKPFLDQVLQGYIACGEYLQSKLPLESMTLQCLSAVDPIARGHSKTGCLLRQLAEMLNQFLPADVDVQQEVLQYGVDQSLPTFREGDDAVSWWAAVFEKGRYPGLSMAVKAALSVFHGPLVESSFSLMSEIIDSRSSSMNISTLSAIQTVKHTLLTRKQTALQMFKRENLKYGPVDQRMCHNIMSAGTKDKALRKQATLNAMERRREFDCQPSSSAAAARRAKAEEEALARRRHAAKQRKRACETIVQAKKQKK